METLIAASIVFLLVALAIRSTLRLAYGRRGPTTDDVIYLLLNVTSLVFITLSIAASLIFMSGPLALPLCILAAFTAVMALARHRAMQRRALLSMLAAAVEKDLPLSETLTAFAAGHHNRIGLGARRLAHLLEEGRPLPDAVKECSYALPLFAEVFARTGQEIGAIGSALGEANASESFGRSLSRAIVGRVFYILPVLIVGIAVSAFMMVKIVPQFVTIYDEFGIDFSGLTTSVVGAAHMAVNYWQLTVLFLFAAIGALCIWIAYDLGWLHGSSVLQRLTRQLHSSVVLRVLALATERSRPLGPVLKSMAEAYPGRYIGRRLHRIAIDVEQGGDWCEGLERMKLISRSDAGVLQSAQRVGNLSWALRLTANGVQRRFGYRLQAAVQVLSPVAILLLGVMVMVFVVGMFLPLVNLIQAMS